jgi:hypothetical protein
MLVGKALAMWIGGSLCACALANVLLVRIVPDAGARWYLLHALVNTVVTIMVVPDCLALLRSPLDALDAPYTDVPLALTVGLHLFHCLRDAHKLTLVDWAHHLVSNMLVCGLVFPFRYGPVVNWGCLFVCGLPGGIDYYLLYAVKEGWMTKLNVRLWMFSTPFLGFVPRCVLQIKAKSC